VYRLTRLPLAGLVAFRHLQFSQIRGRQPYLIVRNILYVIAALYLRVSKISPEPQPAGSGRFPGRDSRPADRSVFAPARDRHRHACRQGAVSDDGSVRRVRAFHDRRAGARWHGACQGERDQERSSNRLDPQWRAAIKSHVERGCDKNSRRPFRARDRSTCHRLFKNDTLRAIDETKTKSSHPYGPSLRMKQD